MLVRALPTGFSGSLPPTRAIFGAENGPGWGERPPTPPKYAHPGTPDRDNAPGRDHQARPHRARPRRSRLRTEPAGAGDRPHARQSGLTAATPTDPNARTAHTPACPGLNAPPGVPGPVVALRRRASAGASGRAHAVSVGRNVATTGGWEVCAHHFFGSRAPGARGFVDTGRVSPASRVAAHTPRRPTPTPRNAATLPAKKQEWGWRRSGLRKDPAGLKSRPRRTTEPRHHKKP